MKKNKRYLIKIGAVIMCSTCITLCAPANTQTSTQTPVVSGIVTTVQAATLGQKNAVIKAKNYLNVLAFSKKGLIKQLKYEGFTTAEAKYAVKHCGANWNQQAAKKAKSYLAVMAFSKNRLIKQLMFDGFTKKQALYGVKKAGY